MPNLAEHSEIGQEQCTCTCCHTDQILYEEKRKGATTVSTSDILPMFARDRLTCKTLNFALWILVRRPAISDSIRVSTSLILSACTADSSLIRPTHRAKKCIQRSGPLPKSAFSIDGKLTFLQIEIEPNACCGSGDFFPQSLFEFFYVCHETLVFALHEGKVVSLEQLEFGFETSKVDFLGVVGLVALFARDETFGEIGDAFIDDVSK